MAIVKEYYIGKTLIRVDDTYYKDKTKEESDEVIQRCIRIYQEYYVNKKRQEMISQSNGL